jgi:branched-subunit amino acid ABC-type transport system permease component
LEFHSVLLGPSIVSGLSQAGLYAMLAIALVLTYQVSRTVAFVHGGLAICGAMGLWWLTYDSFNYTGPQPVLPKVLGFAIVIVFGAVGGTLYGALVTGRRLAAWPKITLTVLSLGIMLTIAGTISGVFTIGVEAAEVPASPFGDGMVRLFDVNVSVHQIATIVLAVVLVGVLGYISTRTRGGVYLRAVADDVEASRWVGIPLHRVGTAVYGVSGAIACLAGALIAPVLGPSLLDVYFVFLRALSAAVIGGFTSYSLAVGGALFFGVVDSALRSGVFGDTSPGGREMITVGAVFLAVAIVARYRKKMVELVQAEGM